MSRSADPGSHWINDLTSFCVQYDAYTQQWEGKMKGNGHIGKLLLAAAMSFGLFGLAHAQDSTFVRIDIDSVAQALELSDDAKRALAPRIEALNDALERRWDHRQEGVEIQQEFSAVYDSIANTLTAAQLREFNWHLRRKAVGPRAAGWDRAPRYQDRRGMRGFNRGSSRMRDGRGRGFNRGRYQSMRNRGRMRSPAPRMRPIWRPIDDVPNG